MRKTFPLSVISSIIFVSSILYCSAVAADEPSAVAAPQRVLFVFAHQDDEVCIAARLKTDALAGRQVDVVWITNGDKAGDAAVREKESRGAMKFLGVPESGLHFLGFEDQEAHKNLRPAYEKILEIAGAVKPDAIFSNAYEGGHIDHDSAHFVAEMVSRALPGRPPHYEFPLYNSYNNSYRVGEFIPREGLETLSTPLDDKLIALKLKMLEMYPSQQALFNVMGRLVNRKKLKRTGEPYRLVPDYDYLKPPTDGTLGYELENNRIPHKFAEFQAVVQKFYDEMKEKK